MVYLAEVAELTETASANSCCSVFHSSVVKVPAQYVMHTAISLVEISVHRGLPLSRGDSIAHSVCRVMEKIGWRWFPQRGSIYDNMGHLGFIPTLPFLLVRDFQVHL